MDGNKITFIVDNDGRIIGATVGETKYNAWNRINMQSEETLSMDTLYLSSLGKQIGLSYSDFGTYTIPRWLYNDDGDPTIQEKLIAHHVSFAGGYASQQIDSDNIAKDLHFYGGVVGAARDDSDMIPLDGSAWLDFDTKTKHSTLTAMLRNWYDIEVKDDGTIIFDNYFGNGNVRFGDEKEYTKTGAKMNVGFYGENPASNIPTEAAGTVQFHDTDTNIKMDIAFGVK